MLLPCEVAVRSLVPAIRSTLARELVQKHGLKQKEVAALLGVTQTAVSKYIRKVRGITLSVEEIKEVNVMLSDIIFMLADGRISKYQFSENFCVICQTIRRNGLMCKLCKRSDPSMDVHQCFVCRPEK